MNNEQLNTSLQRWADSVPPVSASAARSADVPRTSTRPAGLALAAALVVFVVLGIGLVARSRTSSVAIQTADSPASVPAPVPGPTAIGTSTTSVAATQPTTTSSVAGVPGSHVPVTGCGRPKLAAPNGPVADSLASATTNVAQAAAGNSVVLDVRADGSTNQLIVVLDHGQPMPSKVADAISSLPADVPVLIVDACIPAADLAAAETKVRAFVTSLDLQRGQSAVVSTDPIRGKVVVTADQVSAAQILQRSGVDPALLDVIIETVSFNDKGAAPR